MPDTLQDCTQVTHVQRALLCCPAKAEGLGAARPWAQGPGKNKTLKNCSWAGEAALWLCLCLGGLCCCGCQDCAEDGHSFQSKCKEAPGLGRKGSFALIAEAKALSGMANWATWHTNPTMPQVTQDQAEGTAGLSQDALPAQEPCRFVSQIVTLSLSHVSLKALPLLTI